MGNDAIRSRVPLRSAQRPKVAHLVAAFCAAVLSWPSSAAGEERQAPATVPELEASVERLEKRDREQQERIDELEAQVFESSIDEDRAILRAFDAVELTMGGFLSQAFSYAHGDDRDAFSADQTLFELLLSADIGNRVTLFTALGFLRAADADISDPARPRFRDTQNRVPQIIAWANYRAKDPLQIRVGRFVTPQGIINVEHFPPVLLELNQPQFLRPFSGSTLFPNFTNGIQVHGSSEATSAGRLGYSLYGGVFNEAPEDPIYGARLEWKPSELGIVLGANYSGGTRDRRAGEAGSLSLTGNSPTHGGSYNIVGIDLLLDRGSLLWKNEAYFSWESGNEDRLAFYTQPAWRLTDEWSVFYRFDFLDAGQDLPRQIENVLGLNFLPIPQLRLRAAVFHIDRQRTSDDVLFSQLSATVSF